MNKSGPIVVIEDDLDDQHLLTMAFHRLGYPNEVMFFSEGQKALEYLRQEEIMPFLILSDINMPKQDGFQLKQVVQTDPQLGRKCIPYLFFTTAPHPEAVYDAYTLSAQGFFLKSTNYEHLVDTIRKIVEYWQQCYSPSRL